MGRRVDSEEIIYGGNLPNYNTPTDMAGAVVLRSGWRPVSFSVGVSEARAAA